LIYDELAAYEGDEGRQLMSKMIAGHMRLAEDMRAAGVTFSGHQLQPATVAATVRNASGAQTLHDGPFAETKEQLGGVYLIEEARPIRAFSDLFRRVPPFCHRLGWLPSPGALPGSPQSETPEPVLLCNDQRPRDGRWSGAEHPTTESPTCRTQSCRRS